MRRLIESLLFFVILFFVAFISVRIIRPKDGSGIYDMRDFYSLDRDSVDVLMLGSSLSFINIDPAVLWENKGIAAYSLGGAVQPFGNSYYYLKEALKYQSPKLVTLEVFGATLDGCSYNRCLNNVEGIRSPINRFAAIKASAPMEKWIPLFLGFPEYHNRYSQLSDEDFLPYRGRKEFEYYLGHGTYYQTEPQEEPNVNIEIDPILLSPYAEGYLNKIIDLCKNEHIPLFLFSSPTAQYEDYKGYYLTVEKIAKENNLFYMDFNKNFKDMQLDFATDFADGNHLNQSGCPKFSTFFSGFICDTYKIPDRRNENGFDRWVNAARFYDASESNYQLSQTDNIEQHFNRIQNASKANDYLEIIWVSGNESDRVKKVLSENGVPIERGYYVINSGEISKGDDNRDYFMDFGASTYVCNEDGMFDPHNQVIQAGQHLTNVVFDRFTMKIADSNYYDLRGRTEEKPVEDLNITWVGRGD